MKRKSISRRIPRVIAVVSMESNFGPSVLRGVFAHIAERGEWSLSIVRSNREFTGEYVRQAIAHKASGFIVAMNDDAPEAFKVLAESAVPFATVETFSSVLGSRKTGAIHVRIDNSAIGRDAAKNFAAQGRYASFGFIPAEGQREWSRLRGEGFEAELTRRDRPTVTFMSSPAGDTLTRRGKLAKWLRRMEKPAAILAADDAVAQEALLACKSAGLSVPGDVAVLGVDDEELICENATPRLSSIRPDFVLAGKEAAASLERMMGGSKAASRPSHTVIVRGENEIVRRATTVAESSAGPLVQKALAFIARNAKRGIGVKDVQAHLKVSRALMDLRFREVRGESVLSCITAVRLKELKRLLRETDDPIESITRRLGWTSPNYPKNLFRRHFGISMRDYRAQNSHR